jgi:hypothetical protein
VLACSCGTMQTLRMSGAAMARGIHAETQWQHQLHEYTVVLIFAWVTDA